MNLTETADLLMVIAAYDQRTVGEADVIAWHQVLHDVDLSNAKAAVIDHYGAKLDRIMPAHVRAGVKRVRSLALERTEDPIPPFELTDNPAGYRRWMLNARRSIADRAGSNLVQLPQRS